MCTLKSISLFVSRTMVIIVYLIVFVATPCCWAVDGYMGIVTADPGQIMDGDKVLATIPKGTRLWIFSEKANRVEIKLPGKQLRGWLKTEEIKQFEPTEADNRLLKATYGQLKKAESLANQNQYAEAHKLFDESEVTIRQVLGSESPYIGGIYISQGDLFRLAGDYGNAYNKYELAKQHFINHFGEHDVSVAQVLNNLSTLSKLQGNYEQAKQYIIDSLRIKIASGNVERSEFAKDLRSAGILCSELDDSLKARYFLEQALELQRQLPDQLELASTLNSLGIVYVQQGNYLDAQKQYSEALKIKIQVLGAKHVEVAETLSNLGTLALDQLQYEAAENYLQQALNMKREVLGQDDLRTASSLINLAVIQELQKKYRPAQALLVEALQILNKHHKQDHPDIASVFNNTGHISVMLGDYDRAAKELSTALELRERLLGKNHSDTVTTNLNLLQLEVRRKNDQRAIDYADNINRILHTQLQQILPGLEEYSQLLYLEHKYQPIWNECLALGWLKRTEASAIAKSAEWLLNGKSITQEVLTTRTLLTRGAPDKDLVLHMNRLQMVRQQLAALTISGKVVPARQDTQLKVDQLIEQEQLLAKQVAQRNGLLGYSQGWHSLAELRKSIPANTTFIDIIRTPLIDDDYQNTTRAHYLAWIIPATKEGDPRIVDLGSASEIERTIDSLRTSIAAAIEPNGTLVKLGEPNATAKLDQELLSITKLVWLPLQQHLGRSQSIIISPDGDLWLLPWSILPMREKRLLIEDYSIRFILSGRDLLKQAERQHEATSPAVFANPNYNLSSKQAQDKLYTLLPELKHSFPPFTGQQIQPLKASDLPYTAIEGESAIPLLTKLTKLKPQLFTRDEALELVAKRTKNPRYLYFATHGFFLQDQTVQLKQNPDLTTSSGLLGTAHRRTLENPLLRCGLLLAGCNSPRTPGLDDGILTGLEIVGMDLRGTELVVLSACETGIGKVRNGEGVAGLRQAFQLAGAQSVVSTLWQVPDRDSAIIMQDFFKNLAAGQSKAEALRNAQLTRIAARKDKYGAAHPFFWAAWTVTGE